LSRKRGNGGRVTGLRNNVKRGSRLRRNTNRKLKSYAKKRGGKTKQKRRPCEQTEREGTSTQGGRRERRKTKRGLRDRQSQRSKTQVKVRRRSRKRGTPG